METPKKIPQFLYVPRINTLGISNIENIKFIIETRKNTIFQIAEFEQYKLAVEFSRNDSFFKENNVLSVNIHKKYPLVLMCLKTGITNSQRLIKIGNIALDWYVQFWLENKKLSNPKFNGLDDDIKIKEYYSHWVWGNNFLSQEKYSYLINLEYGVSIKFNYVDSIRSSFENFEHNMADVQFLNGHRPSYPKVQEIIIDAWNFLAIEERLLEGCGLYDFDKNILS